ncbi:MAG: SurA N-terminal domain-containing protein [Azovibrio sp.]|nr:SurA N-terminal domain-containing protein [Azovibrio sp.]
MFDAVRNNKRIVQVFLLLITIPFAMWGLDSYMKSDGGTAQVAKVGDVKITLSQFQQALREQQDRMRAQFPGIDAKLLDSPTVRESVLNGLVDQQLLLQEVQRLRLGVSVQALQSMIASIPAFHEDGRFSQRRYEAVLAAEGMTPAGFEAQLRRDLALQSLIGAVGESAFVARTVAERLVGLQTQTRQVQEVVLPWQSFVAQVQLEAAEIERYYEENRARFTVPEQIRVEYLQLSQNDLDVTVSEADVKAWYDSHRDQYTQPEERRASHILLTGANGDKAKARAEAEALLAELQKHPGQFAELARKRSQDPGSASKGGDLGFFGRGMMVKPFEEAVFALKEGELSGLIESDFGVHIIQLTGIKPARVQPLAEVRGQIEAELKRERAARAFAEAAEHFANLVYEQSDSLKPAAEAYKLAVRQSGWITRAGGEGVFAHPKLIEALFSVDVVQNGRNTEAIEVAPGTLVAARKLDYKPATLRPLETVKPEIEARLKEEKALALAARQGEAKLAALKAGQNEPLAWGASQNVSRIAPGKLAPAALAAVFRVDAGKLPAYAGVELPGVGYALYKVSKVENAAAAAEVGAALKQQLNSLAASAEVEAYMAALRQRYKVEVRKDALRAKD